MLRLRILFSLLLSGSFTSFTAAQTTDTLENSLLWKVSGNGLKKPSYLFGTYHLLTETFANNVNGVKKAFSKSKTVVGEVVLDADLQAKMMGYMVMEKGTLDSLLPKERYDSLSNALLERAGLPIMLLNKMKPMAVYTIFSTTELKKSGLLETDKGVPMDMYFQQEGRKKKKEVLGLETVDEQAEILFGSSSLDRQAELLMEYVRKGSKDSQEQNRKMKTCYEAQRLNCLEQMMTTSGFSDSETLALLDKRNNAWIPQLQEMMKKQPCFIAVGALHLTGNTGLIKQLRDQGYKVEPVSVKK